MTQVLGINCFASGLKVSPIENPLLQLHCTANCNYKNLHLDHVAVRTHSKTETRRRRTGAKRKDMAGTSSALLKTGNIRL